jgi:threonine/homoserine/homoserine lactone efflux protein
MLAVLLKAIPIGLLLSIMPGAAFFSVIQTSISRGFRAGLFLAFGISLSDIFLVALCLFGIAGLMENNETAQLVMGIVGGIILIVFGGYTFLNMKSDLNPQLSKSLLLKECPNGEEINGENKRIKYLAKGFALNVSNPFVWLLWLGIVPYSGVVLKEQVFFLLFILITVFSMDMLKSYFAGKIKQILTPEVIFLINRIVGLVIACLGVFLIIIVFFWY